MLCVGQVCAGNDPSSRRGMSNYSRGQSACVRAHACACVCVCVRAGVSQCVTNCAHAMPGVCLCVCLCVCVSVSHVTDNHNGAFFSDVK